MIEKKCVVRVLSAIIIVQFIAMAGCQDAQEKETLITKPVEYTSQTSGQSDKELTIDDTTTTQTEISPSTSSVGAPMNPITEESFREICLQQGYIVKNQNYEDSGLEVLLSGSDHNHFYYQRYTQFTSEDIAKVEMQNIYERIIDGDEGRGYFGDISYEEKDGYGIIIEKSTEEFNPSYSVYLRVNNVIIDSCCFSVLDADYDKVNKFISAFGYAVE